MCCTYSSTVKSLASSNWNRINNWKWKWSITQKPKYYTVNWIKNDAITALYNGHYFNCLASILWDFLLVLYGSGDFCYEWQLAFCTRIFFLYKKVDKQICKFRQTKRRKIWANIPKETVKLKVDFWINIVSVSICPLTRIFSNTILLWLVEPVQSSSSLKDYFEVVGMVFKSSYKFLLWRRSFEERESSGQSQSG